MVEILLHAQQEVFLVGLIVEVVALAGIGKENDFLPEPPRSVVELQSLTPVYGAIFRAMEQQERGFDIGGVNHRGLSLVCLA